MIDLAILARLASSDLDEEEERVAEEHVLGCSACARTLERLVTIGAEVSALVARGEGRAFVTGAILQTLQESGLVTRTYELAAGSVVACAVTAADRYVLTVLRADLEGVARVDVVVGDHRIEDVTFDADRKSVALIERAEFLRTLPTMKIPIRVIGDGRTLAEYTLDHTGLADHP